MIISQQFLQISVRVVQLSMMLLFTFKLFLSAVSVRAVTVHTEEKPASTSGYIDVP